MKLTVAVAALALLSGCISSDNAVKAAVASACGSGGGCAGLEGIARDSCLLKAATDCGDQNMCGGIADRELEYRCLLRFGTLDLILCSGIGNQSVREECYVNGALLKRDPTICDKIGNQYSEDMCRARYGYEFDNRTVCNDIKHFERRDFCFAVADKDGTICGNMINSDLRITCVEWTMKKLPKV